MENTKLRLFADDRGIWREATSGSPFGIAWEEVHRISGHKLDGITTVYTCVVLDWEYGEYVELYDDSPGFTQVVAAITERLPGISTHWFERIKALGLDDAPLEVWRCA